MTRPIWILLATGLLSVSSIVSAETAPIASARKVPANLPQTEAQRKAYAPRDKSPVAIVNKFNQMAFFDHRPVEAMKTFLAESFIERSPDFAREGYANDKAGLVAYFETRGWKEGQGLSDTIYQVIAEGERVMVYHLVKMGPDDKRGTAFVDIFRVKRGLIVEHWAIAQPVPANTTPQHSMF